MTDPTYKSKGVDNFLKAIMGDRKEAVNNDVCVKCKEEVKGFKDKISMNEFAISGLCQVCQDEFWG